MSSGKRSKEEEISRGAPMTTGAPLGAPAGAFQPVRYAPALEMPRRILLCRGVGDGRRSRRDGIGPNVSVGLYWGVVWRSSFAPLLT